MTTPRDIISNIQFKPTTMDTRPIGDAFADAVIDELKSDGFHIMSDAELKARDNATLDNAASAIDDLKMHDNPNYATCGTSKSAYWSGQAIAHDQAADAIRKLKGKP